MRAVLTIHPWISQTSVLFSAELAPRITFRPNFMVSSFQLPIPLVLFCGLLHSLSFVIILSTFCNSFIPRFLNYHIALFVNLRILCLTYLALQGDRTLFCVKFNRKLILVCTAVAKLSLLFVYFICAIASLQRGEYLRLKLPSFLRLQEFKLSKLRVMGWATQLPFTLLKSWITAPLW